MSIVEGNDFWGARNTKEEAYQQIVKDLRSAEAVLPLTYPTTDLGRATQGASLF